MKPILALWLSFLFTMTNPLLAQYLVVGTYTNNNSTSKGIYIYSFNKQDGSLEQVSMISTTNPSYQVVAKDQKTVYSVNETAAGKISAFAFDAASKQLSLLNTVESLGDDPCYLELDQTGRWLFCSNYSSGSFSIYAIQPDGSLGPLSQFIKHAGHGPDTSRQEGPHVHSTTISPDNHFLFVCDLGTDQITSYPFDAATGKVDTAATFITNTTPGTGPRHIALSKNGRFLYNVTEMGGTVSAYALTNGKLQLLQTEDQLKAEKGKAAGADIHFSPNGKFLYVSQRSNSTIEIYKANRKNGKLSFAGTQSTNGNFPRNFTIGPSGTWLLAANQKSDNITIYKVNKRTGLLTATGKEIKAGIPVSLKWILK
ncbi:6-phosphogluconolactonase [Niabella ginsenosidivorans]|uniref:6-phosphogluconolactonase n=1 Tax=Niabella ginsenosidivorans TaxID=1176587 RepID=A0A1A9I1N7_9BACT|nr:lactonase family protein [Niabella ginsenosidivorans]ANH81245.1 6-phosphogluconolactonase [Niabella ginsenosidivorans]